MSELEAGAQQTDPERESVGKVTPYQLATFW
jgi:hypothetical protein